MDDRELAEKLLKDHFTATAALIVVSLASRWSVGPPH